MFISRNIVIPDNGRRIILVQSNGRVAVFRRHGPDPVAPPTSTSLDFSDSTNSGLLALLEDI
jgi:hypothetical protein